MIQHNIRYGAVHIHLFYACIVTLSNNKAALKHPKSLRGFAAFGKSHTAVLC